MIEHITPSKKSLLKSKKIKVIACLLCSVYLLILAKQVHTLFSHLNKEESEIALVLPEGVDAIDKDKQGWGNEAFVDQQKFEKKIASFRLSHKEVAETTQEEIKYTDSVTMNVTTLDTQTQQERVEKSQRTSAHTLPISESIVNETLKKYLSDSMVSTTETSGQLIVPISGMIEGVLLTHIDTFSNGTVLIKLLGKNIAPLNGGIAKGKTYAVRGNRFFIDIEKIVLDSGQEILVDASVFDRDGTAGIQGKQTNTIDTEILKSVSKTALNISTALINNSSIKTLISDTTEDPINRIDTTKKVYVEKNTYVTVLFEEGVFL